MPTDGDFELNLRDSLVITGLLVSLFAAIIAVPVSAEIVEGDVSTNSVMRVKVGKDTVNTVVRYQGNANSNAEERKAEFAKKMQEIRDHTKKTIVERVNNALAMVNENKVQAWAQHVEQLAYILIRVETHVQEHKSTGIDTSDAEAAVAEAKTALSTAQQALDAQAAKDYTLIINDESTLRVDVRAMKDQLKNDLKSTHTVVRSAHEAIRKAIRASHASHDETDNESEAESNEQSQAE